MKALTSLRLSILPLFVRRSLGIGGFLLLPFLASAQQKPTFTITDPAKKSLYGDQRISEMKWKDLKSIMIATGDEEIVRNMRKISGKRAASVTCIVIGNLAMAGGLAMMLADSEGSTGLLVGGAGIMVVGAVAGSGSNGLIKRSMMRYNEINGGASFAPGTTSINGQTTLGGTLSFTF